MEQTLKQGPWTTVARVAVALLAGLVVLVLLSPMHGADTIPRQCFSVFGYDVPCGGEVAIAAGVATVGVVGLSLWLKGRRK